MGRALRRLVARIVPAVLVAAGVALFVGGLLAWTDPAVVGSTATPAPSEAAIVTAPPTVGPVPTLAPIPSIGPAGASSGPQVSIMPSPTPRTAVATRVVVPALGIDLPVIPGPKDEVFPYCNVAEYSNAFEQPGQGGPVFLYAHARDGMFLPILDASKVSDGKAMIGMLVQVYTSDDMVFLYEITDVLRHQGTLDQVYAAEGENLFLQTSEGPRAGNPGYTGLVAIVQAKPMGAEAADPKDAHPKPKPIVCS